MEVLCVVLKAVIVEYADSGTLNSVRTLIKHKLIIDWYIVKVSYSK